MRSIFVTGWCAALAVSLAGPTGGKAVAIYDPLDEDWEPLPGNPYLIHAGCLVGNTVFDAEGEWTFDEWSERWADVGSSDCFTAAIPETDIAAVSAEAHSAGMSEVVEEAAAILLPAIKASAAKEITGALPEPRSPFCCGTQGIRLISVP